MQLEPAADDGGVGGAIVCNWSLLLMMVVLVALYCATGV